ncbi:MAG TPA: hypothetical protein VMR74_03400 [Gammaproteobacteria bacterium]|nr:hypothetical protein [Gammaproteobacteria bacterium]
MRLRTNTIRLAVGAIAATAATAAFAQRGGGAPVELDEQRLVPAEQTIDPNYEAPTTSWGDPKIAGHWSTDDMRGVGSQRDPKYGTVESLDDTDFLARAQSQQRGRNSAVETETFLRNEWGTRTFGFNSLVVDPPNGRQPGITEAGRDLAEANASGGTFGSARFHVFNDFSMYDRCIARGLNNGTGAAIYGNGIIITQSPNAVSITYEMIHETRVIPLDDRAHLPLDIKQYGGNGRGYWDGDTLVIESMGFHPKVRVGAATPSDEMRTIERIRRVDDEMIEYRITYNDPISLEAPYTMRVMWTTQPDYYVWEYGCHEGNGAVGHSLSGERAWERQVAAAIAAGEPPPGREGSVYGAPDPEAEIIDINSGE